MNMLEKFHNRLEEAGTLGRHGLSNESGAVLQEAEHVLDKARDRTFRSYIRSMSMASQAKSAAENPDNPLFLQEISHENLLMTYGRREAFLALNLERKLQNAQAIHAVQMAQRHMDNGEPAVAAHLLLETMRRDSLAAPLLEELWRHAQGARYSKNKDEPLFTLLHLEGSDKHPALNQGFGLAVAGDQLLVSKTAGGIEVFDLQGKHLESHPSELMDPLSCSGPHGQAWFASEGTVACFDRNTGLNITFRLEKGHDYPEGAHFKSLTYGSGLLWQTYFTGSAGRYEGALLGLDPATGTVRVRQDLGECCPVAAADATSVAILDTLTCRARLTGSGQSALFGFDQQLTASIPKCMISRAGLFFIADTTTVLIFSATGTLLGRIRPGQVVSRLTDITDLALSPDGKTLFVMDFYSKSLFRIAVKTVWP